MADTTYIRPSISNIVFPKRVLIRRMSFWPDRCILRYDDGGVDVLMYAAEGISTKAGSVNMEIDGVPCYIPPCPYTTPSRSSGWWYAVRLRLWAIKAALTTKDDSAIELWQDIMRGDL